MSLPNVYWLTDRKDTEYLDKSAALNGVFNFIFFSDAENLICQLTISRPDTIVFSTRTSTDNTMADINFVSRNPEAKGLKMILSLEKDDPRTIHLAASLCFREILPLNISSSTWTKRFKFATSSKSQKLSVTVPPETAITQAIFRAPSRINWVEKDRICIETSMFFDPGYKFTLLGPFAAFLGHRDLPLTVVERQSKRLRYRHSSSIICKINSEEIQGFNTTRLKTVARSQASSAPLNIYAVAKSQLNRQQISTAFGQHNVLFATKMVTAAREIEYFEPDALIVEESFLQNKEVQKLIDRRLTCILSDLSGLPFLTPANANIKLFKLVKEIHKYLQLKVPMSQRAKDSKWYIPEVSDFSRCSVQFSGTVEKANKDFMIVNSPNRARSYSLVEVSLIGNAVSEYVKLCEQIPGHEGQVASSFVSMVLCSSSDAFVQPAQSAKIIEIARERTKSNLNATPGGEKAIVKARPTSQIAPGHEFYQQGALRDVSIQYRKPSVLQNIVASLDSKTLIQAVILSLVGLVMIYLLNIAIQNPNTNMSGFSSWFSDRAVQSGK